MLRCHDFLSCVVDGHESRRVDLPSGRGATAIGCRFRAAVPVGLPTGVTVRAASAAHPSGEREPRQEASAPAGRALQRQRPAECLDPVCKAAQPAALFVGPADAVIEHLDRERLPVGPQVGSQPWTRRRACTCSPVPRRRRSRRPPRPAREVADRTSVCRSMRDARTEGKRFEGLHQAALGEHGRVQTAGELPDLLEARGQLVDG